MFEVKSLIVLLRLTISNPGAKVKVFMLFTDEDLVGTRSMWIKHDKMEILKRL